MTLALIWFGAVAALELLLPVTPLWLLRRPLAAGLLVAVGAASGILFVAHPSLASGLLVLTSLYRIFNLLRIVEGRMVEPYLRRVTLRTSLWLMLLQLLALLFWAATDRLQLSAHTAWLVLGVLQVLSAVGIAAATRKNLKATMLPRVAAYRADRDLPSISVCIPARNETEALDSCLHSLIASNYPKLEILVLDDQSHDRTPEIIRSFAHDGVRFIKGNEVPEGWLAKNWAYERLFEEASGEVLLFMGVDVRLGKNAVRTLITQMLEDRRQMVSVVPANTARDDNRRSQSVLLQPARYAWELCLPRQSGNRPAVLSTVWAASHELLKKAGGFAGVRRNITPESYAAKLAASEQAYSLWQATPELDFSSSKSFHDQWNTAVRTRYPQLHKRPELVLLLSFAQAVSLVLPFGMAVGGLLLQAWVVAALGAGATVVQCWVYGAIVRFTYRKTVVRGFVALPATITLDIYLRHVSMWRYEFGKVIWKERDVTPPVMHVIPKLPPLA